ncbi:MAG TPA: hypothetical protein VEZ12_03995 [Herpetosiphonaceae bacterium]|nr:hypothetical protein [Herpetosiphonaceae bacterium]
MIGALLQQPASGTFSPGIIIALALVVLASSLALGIAVGLSKRIKAIGDAGPATGKGRVPDEEDEDG